MYESNFSKAVRCHQQVLTSGYSPVQFRKYYPVLGFIEHSPKEVPSQNALAQDWFLIMAV